MALNSHFRQNVAWKRRLDTNSTCEERSILCGVLVNKTVLTNGQHGQGEDQLECSGYQENGCKRCMFVLLCVVTLGLALLVTRWKPQWKYYLTKSQCPLARADAVLLKDQCGQFFTASINTIALGDGVPEFMDEKEEGYNSSGPENTSDTDETSTLTISQPDPVERLKCFDHHHIRYIWDRTLSNFKRLVGLDVGTKCSAFHDQFQGLSASVQSQKLRIYRPNDIDIEVKSYWRLFIDEVLNPFYIFQVMSVVLWFSDEYYYYAGCIVLISLISISVSLHETRRQSETLRDMVAMTTSEISVCRGNREFDDVSVRDLVPGDVIAIPSHGCVMSCDAVLVQGNCIVNESMLTGESVPVTKTPLSFQEDEEVYSPDEHKRHTLFSGTRVIQTRYYGQAKVLAVVIRTGFSTSKGELIRSILFPKPIGFKFYQDAMKFILFLGCVAAVGMIYSIVILIQQQTLPGKIVLRALDIITIVVPPALPAAMTVGMVYAQSRLKKQGIFCISPPRINFCGKLKLICFDKTGTLTEEGLDLWGVIPAVNQSFSGLIHEPASMPRTPFIVCMATCHSLTMIGGELNGDPLDLKMFNSINWDIEEPGEDRTWFDCLMPTVVKPRPLTPLVRPGYYGYPSYESSQQILEEPGNDTSKFESIMPTVVKPCTRETFLHDTSLPDKPPFEVGIVRQFTFSSSMQRMSVIARILGQDHMTVFVKGAPEKITSLCRPDTVPENFHDVLHRFTVQGYRVIALAYRDLNTKLTWHQAQRISRDKVECGLEFLGLLIMRNTVKPETRPVIMSLRAANIRTVMVTGDNVLTAVSVARDCGMVQQRDRVIMVEAMPPDNNKPASIQWQFAETPGEKPESDAELTSEATPFISTTSGEGQSYHAISLNDDIERYHFAVTGKSFAIITSHFPELMPKICTRGTIFARMSPEQKAELVKHLQSLGYGVGMCGDGANDCMALKAAHAGISLSEAEASVASPFTSKTQNIECVPIIVREGRAALVTSFGCFKFMALYSMIQFVSVLTLYNFKTNLSDFMFLYIDLAITTTVAFLMGYTGAYRKLVADRPAGSLLKLSILISILVQVLLVASFQIGSYYLLRSQPWFVPVVPTPSADNYQCYETTTIFFISAYQYMTLAFTYSKGPPFRKRIWSNLLFTLSLIGLVLFTAFLLFFPPEPLQSFFKLQDIPDLYFKLKMVGIIAGNFMACVIIEYILCDSKTFQKFCRLLRNKKQPKNMYKTVEKELRQTPDWPPVGHVTSATNPLDSGVFQYESRVDVKLLASIN